MAFLRAEQKKSLAPTPSLSFNRIRLQGSQSKRRSITLGKVEDYSANQLERVVKKLLELVGKRIEDIITDNFHELRRYNYGYALIVNRLWNTFSLNHLVKVISNRKQLTFNWQDVLKIMIAEKINESSSKLQSSFNRK